MGFLSKLGNAAMGNFSGLGGMLNDVTGATSSAALQQKYALQNAAVNHAYQKEFAQNAHQWEMQDLQKAGLNPALTATGGSGASASGGGSFGGSGGQSAGNPFDILNMIVGMQNQTSATKSQNNLNAANAMLAIAHAKNLPEQVRAQMLSALAQQTQAEASQTNAAANYNNYWLNKDKNIEEIKKIKAETKYTKERARGFSYSTEGHNIVGGVKTSRTY